MYKRQESREYSDFPGHWTSLYRAWIEDFPDDKVAVIVFGVHCGDAMFADIWQDYSPSGIPIKAHMFIEDNTSGLFSSFFNTTTFSNESTAEWIIERGDPASGALARFNFVIFTDCFAKDFGVWSSPVDLSHNYSTMFWNNHSLVHVGPLNPTPPLGGANFRMDWVFSS